MVEDISSIDFSQQEYVLCMVKKIGATSYRFFFQTKESSLDFYGKDFEEKPSSICNDLIPDETAYAFACNAEAPKEYYTNELSNVYSMQDSLDKCVALMFDRDYDVEEDKRLNGRLVLNFGEELFAVSDKLCKYGFTMDDDFPQREPESFLSSMFSKEKEDENNEVRLAFVRLHKKILMKLCGETPVYCYSYSFFYVDKSRLSDFSNCCPDFQNKCARLCSPMDFGDFKFDYIEDFYTEYAIDTIEDQNEYSMQECIDNCVCLASENIDGREYPEHRVVFKFGEPFGVVKQRLIDKKKESEEEFGS